METGYRCLDLTLVSAEGLKDVNLFTTMDVYVVVQLLGYGSRENKKRTHIDRNGGINPRWNHRIKFTIDEHLLKLKNNPTLSVLFQLKSERTFGSDRIIGEVTILMEELYEDWAGSDNINYERVVDYQVRTSSGKPKGTLKISYKFGENYVNQQQPSPPRSQSLNNNNNKKNAGFYYDEPVTAYPSASGTSMAYAPYPQGMGYAAAGYPGYGGYPPGPPHGYAPVAPGYNGGYVQHVPPGGYGYPAGPPIMQQEQPKKNKGKMGMGAGLGLGLGAGLLGGMLVGDMVSDVGEMAAYTDGYSDAMGNGGFDF